MTDDESDARATEFPEPPRDVDDVAGRRIHLREGRPADREALVGMYAEFDAADRAQGIPPSGEERIRTWLENVLTEEALDVVAEHDGEVVGHGMLVPDHEGGYEVALFVLQVYQGAGIGTELLRTMLGLAETRGVGRVWLSVERWNEAALAVYEKVGFQRTGTGGFEFEMAMDLD